MLGHEPADGLEHLVDHLLLGENARHTGLRVELNRDLNRRRVIAERTPVSGHQRLLHDLNNRFFWNTTLGRNL